MYIYGNGDWGDQLTNYNGYSLTYDVMGNPTSYYNGSRMNMSWGHSGVLKALTFGSTTVGYTYNDGGVRTSKTVNGVLHSYSLDGSVIMSESFADKLLIYLYDEFGTPFGIKYRESDYALGEFDCYIFEKNLHGDIIGIFSEAGARVASYEYDAWGNCVNMTYASGYGVICNLNPFRYRSYYYDTETGFYYCGSRYYDPSLGRFISADSVGTVALTPMSYTDKNLYAYCDNNPVMRTDNGGEFWDTFFDVVSLCASVIDVVKNPDDPWAWVGLAADVVSVAVPFATGGGAVVDAVTSVDEFADLAKNVDRTFEGVDTVSDLGKTSQNIAEIATTGTPNQIGQIGEQLAGISSKEKTPILINGRIRIPDKLTAGVLTEVKNVKYISNTQQLKDYADFARKTGRQLELYVRPTTKVSQTVLDAGWQIKYLWQE